VASKYFSRRALGLHLALVMWLAMCIFAAWWQVTRAFAGNSLSYLYAVEWPCFAILGFVGWWALLHNEKPSKWQEEARLEYEERMRAEAAAARQVDSIEASEDPELAAYNDHLADLAKTTRKKFWSH